MCVLRYIQNTRSQFKIFVANRLEIIYDATDVARWFFVPTKQNPADAASRGLYPDQTEKIREFIQGPEFLKKEAYPNFEHPKEEATDEEKAEIKKNDALIATTETEAEAFLPMLTKRYSNLHKLFRAAAILQKFSTWKRKRDPGSK